MKLPFFTYDVFTREKFSGNPLAIVMEADALTDRQMQTIAREFNLSETIFVRKPADPANTASVRIFFPTAEIPFAGHPTIGCAIHLAALTQGQETEIRLEEVAGLVPVKVARSGAHADAVLTAPVVPFPVARTLPDKELVARAAGLSASDIGIPGHGLGLHEGGPRFFFVPLRSAQALARVQPSEPHWTEMTKITGADNAYFYVQASGEADFQARMFWKGEGIPEDPATGSASALLASQLLASGVLGEGTNGLRLLQGVEMGRPSRIRMEADVAGAKLKAVRIGGSAVKVSSGILEV